MSLEPLLNTENHTYVFSVKHNDINQFYIKHRSMFWSPEEIDLSKDLNDWIKLNSDEQYFIKHILAFFAASDGIVNENLLENFSKEIQYPEVKAFYSIQIAMETIHSETYRILIETYVPELSEQTHLFNAITTHPSIKQKANWALKWTNPLTNSFQERLIAFIAVEGIFFSGSFCAIFWLKKRGLMPGLSFSNELISRDEGLHCDFAIHLYNNHVKNKLPNCRILEILNNALIIEKQFVIESLPVKLIGMNMQLMTEYLEYLTDRLLIQLGCEYFYNTKNPFDFMTLMSLEGKTNFFEKRVSEYKKPTTQETLTFTFDEDF